MLELNREKGKLLGFSRLYQPDVLVTVATEGQQSYSPLKLEELGSGPDVLIPNATSTDVINGIDLTGKYDSS